MGKRHGPPRCRARNPSWQKPKRWWRQISLIYNALNKILLVEKRGKFVSTSLPQILHTYQNHSLDSTRWNRYIPRDNDVIVASSLKSGTTWTLAIVRQLIFMGKEAPPFQEIWVDQRFWAIDELIEVLEAQQHRRYVKTHLSLDGLPYYPQVKYIVVARDPRDVFMSLWNHHRHYTTDFYDFINSNPNRVGDPMPLCPPDI